jgi:hypothetical protein
MTQGEQPRARCVLTLEFPSSAEAENVHESVRLENEGYLESAVEGNVLRAEADADSLKSLLHTLDDFMACVGVAHGIVTKKR